VSYQSCSSEASGPYSPYSEHLRDERWMGESEKNSKSEKLSSQSTL